MRYRLYARLGLDAGTNTPIISLSMLSNWIGYLLVCWVIFGFYPIALPPGWGINSTGLQWLGFAMLTLALVYFLLCAVSRQRSFIVSGQELHLPSLRLAALQLGMEAANWLLMGTVVFLLLQQKIEFSSVIGVFMVAAIAGMLTHIPGGLGVLQAVFVVLLAHQLPKLELLAYRGIYYLAPLTLAAVLYLVAEIRAKKLAPPDCRSSAEPEKLVR